MCAVVRLRALMARQAARLITNPPIVSLWCTNVFPVAAVGLEMSLKVSV
jgi:hypothetical protein